jgi:hypothetical protein
LLDLECPETQDPEDQMKFRSKANPSIVVEFVAEAQLRIGETKRLAVIYQRDGYTYVRPKAEFFDKFVLDAGPIPS